MGGSTANRARHDPYKSFKFRVKFGHDRYANMAIDYLLMKLESYGGVAILATNLKSNSDDAFQRRLQIIVG